MGSEFLAMDAADDQDVVSTSSTLGPRPERAPQDEGLERQMVNTGHFASGRVQPTRRIQEQAQPLPQAHQEDLQRDLARRAQIWGPPRECDMPLETKLKMLEEERAKLQMLRERFSVLKMPRGARVGGQCVHVLLCPH